MRNNLYRGKVKEDYLNYHKGEWISGNLLENYGGNNEFLINPKGTTYLIKVEPDTVSQLVQEFNSILFFEGDLLIRDNYYVLKDRENDIYEEGDELIGLIIYDDYDDRFYILRDGYCEDITEIDKYFVYSNEWDEPELANKILNS